MSLAATKMMVMTEIGSQEQTPNIETLLAMQEVEDMISGKIHKNPQNLDNLFEELGINVNRKLLV